KLCFNCAFWRSTVGDAWPDFAAASSASRSFATPPNKQRNVVRFLICIAIRVAPSVFTALPVSAGAVFAVLEVLRRVVRDRLWANPVSDNETRMQAAIISFVIGYSWSLFLKACVID